jgi:hypothetical protein
MSGGEAGSDPVEELLKVRRRLRERVSRQLHDTLGQDLTAAGLDLDLLSMDFSASTPGLHERIADIQGKLEAAFTRVRAIVREFCPDPVERYGMRLAVETLAARFSRERETIKVEIGGTFPVQIGAVLYDCCEALLEHTALNHLPAPAMIVCNPPALSLCWTQNSPVPALLPTGFAAQIISYYVAKKTLEFQVESSPSRGTIITLAFKE